MPSYVKQKPDTHSSFFKRDKAVKQLREQLVLNELSINEGIAQLCLLGYGSDRARQIVYNWLEEHRYPDLMRRE